MINNHDVILTCITRVGQVLNKNVDGTEPINTVQCQEESTNNYNKIIFLLKNKYTNSTITLSLDWRDAITADYDNNYLL